jgi:hypothetical protein
MCFEIGDPTSLKHDRYARQRDRRHSGEVLLQYSTPVHFPNSPSDVSCVCVVCGCTCYKILLLVVLVLVSTFTGRKCTSVLLMSSTGVLWWYEDCTGNRLQNSLTTNGCEVVPSRRHRFFWGGKTPNSYRDSNVSGHIPLFL